jgi:hypothetical protein
VLVVRVVAVVLLVVLLLNGRERGPPGKEDLADDAAETRPIDEESGEGRGHCAQIRSYASDLEIV